MRKIFQIATLLIAAITVIGCTNTTYSKLLKKEKNTIDNYLDREGIVVYSHVPDEWGEKNYYKLPGYSYFYIHIVTPGDSTAQPVKTGDQIVVRYKKYTLTSYPDTVSYWNTDESGYPLVYQQGNLSDIHACEAWHVAVEFMKYPGTVCKLIVPSKLGFTDDNSSVTPYGYDFTFRIQRFK